MVMTNGERELLVKVTGQLANTEQTLRTLVKCLEDEEIFYVQTRRALHEVRRLLGEG